MGEVIGIVFGFSQCLLALVGLTAIYISINNQHNIQKCREIFWELATLPISKPINLCISDENLPYDLYKKIYTYDQIMRTFGSITKSVLKYSCAALIAILLAWLYLIYVFIMNPGSPERLYITLFSLVSMVILFEFLCVFRYLDNISKAAGLPPIDEILDTNVLASNICSILLLALTVRMKIWYGGGDECKITLTTRTPFYNYKVNVSVKDTFKTRYDPGTTRMLHSMPVTDKSKYIKYPEYAYQLDVLSRRIPEEPIALDIKLESSQGSVTLYFRINPLDFTKDGFISGIGYPTINKYPVGLAINKLNQPNIGDWGLTWSSRKS